jgi:hypothetical protein
MAALLAPVGHWINHGRARLRRTRRRTKWLLSIGLALLVLAPGIVYVTLSQVVYTPDLPVRAMFAALQARDSVKLADYVDGCGALCQPGGLSRGYQPPTHVQILSTNYTPPANGDPNQHAGWGESSVLVRYQLGGRTHQDVVVVGRRSTGWARPWGISRAPGEWIDVVSTGLDIATIAGATIKTVKPRQPLEPPRTQGTVFAVPGIYTVTGTSSSLWTTENRELTVAGVIAPTRLEVTLNLALKPDVLDEVRRQIKDHLDMCAQSTSFTPSTPNNPGPLSDCPFRGLEPTSPRNQHWTIVDYPQVELRTEDDGSVTVHTTTTGHARIDYEYTLYPVSPSPPYIAASQIIEYHVGGAVTDDHGRIVWSS